MPAETHVRVVARFRPVNEREELESKTAEQVQTPTPDPPNMTPKHLTDR